MNILAKLGLMKLSEHEARVDEIDEQGYNRWRLADEQIEAAVNDRDQWRKDCLAALEYQADLEAEITTLRHDAQKWRDKLARDRAARKGVGK